VKVILTGETLPSALTSETPLPLLTFIPFHWSPTFPRTAAPDMVGPGFGPPPPQPTPSFWLKSTLINWARSRLALKQVIPPNKIPRSRDNFIALLGVILEDRGFLLLPVNLTEYILKFSNCQATATKAKFEAFVHGHFFRKPATTVHAIPETPTTAFFRPTSPDYTICKWAIILSCWYASRAGLADHCDPIRSDWRNLTINRGF
jgi:hypothetical protein